MSAFTILLILITFISQCYSCIEKLGLCHESNRTCEDCLQADSCCIWIDEQHYTKNRCTINGTENDLVKCIEGKSEIVYIQNKEFSKGEDIDSMVDDPVQIRPQLMKIRLRKGEPAKFKIKYQAVENYPLDLYYLMDLTYSMLSHRKLMLELGKELGVRLHSLTKHYKIGLGYYSDKVLMPFVTTTNKFLENPCYNQPYTCTKPFNFIHALNFTNEFQNFLNELNEKDHTANNDDLEGGFDAVMQLLLCQDEVAWRKISRKLIILATDGFLHTAGDGILAGVVKRNVEDCLLFKQNKYFIYEGTEYDYPSLEEVHRRLKINKVNLLFAVKDKEINKTGTYYSAMVEQMNDVTDIGMLTENPTEILDLMEHAYMKIVQQVTLKVKNENKYIDVEFKSKCGTRKLNKTSHCNNILVGKEYEFETTITLKELPTDKTHDFIEIEEMNINEKLTIEIEYIGVKCNCSDDNTMESIEHGKFDCGIYKCDNGWHGKKCDMECDRKKDGRFINATFISLTCYGRGDFDEYSCRCVCDREYMGSLCQYNQCAGYNKGNVCNGHGTCYEGKCICNADYEGEECNCIKSKEMCIPSGKTIECSGHGECVCGKCECSATETNIKYRGQYCESGSQNETFCNEYIDIIEKQYNNKEEEIAPNYIITEMNNNVTENDIFPLCVHTFVNEQSFCLVKYTYEGKANNTIEIKHTANCSTRVDMATAGGVIFAFVLLVLFVALFIWKVVVTIKDRREYSKFHNETQGETQYLGENPIYKSPNITYRNPLRLETEETPFRN